MEENLQSFLLHGRLFWLDSTIMDIINYAVSYKTTKSVACKALGHSPEHFDFNKNEVELYEFYITNKVTGNDTEAEKKYIKARLWNLIDGSGLLPKDQMNAMKLLLEITIPEKLQDTAILKNLKFDELLQLLDKVK